MAKHKRVDKTLADACVKHYAKIYKHSSDEGVKKAFTESISYDKEELIHWLNNITGSHVKIALGVYTSEYAKTYPGSKEGRLSAFLFSETPGSKENGTMFVMTMMGGDGGDPPSDPTPPSNDDPLNQGTLLP
jgi:hypothetical protein